MFASRKQTASYQSRVIKELDESSTIYGKRLWTEFEIGILKKYYGKKSIRVIAKVLNRTVNATYRKASFLGISFKSES